MRVYPELTLDAEFKLLGELGYTGSLNDRQQKILKECSSRKDLPDLFRLFKENPTCSASSQPPNSSGIPPENQSTTLNGQNVEFDTSVWFVGASLQFSTPIPVSGVTINPLTGVCTLSSLALLTLTNLVIRATNSLGYFEITIQVEVTL